MKFYFVFGIQILFIKEKVYKFYFNKKINN